jgi:L-ascorbate metabolism protein UlaG (beta-lactamase superfamily)
VRNRYINVSWFQQIFQSRQLARSGGNDLKIVYMGHACFRIIGSKVEVVNDPFTGIGLPEPEAQGDLILCSHTHRDHCHVGRTAKPGARELVAFVGDTEASGIKVRGVATYHDDERGAKRGKNSVYVFEIEGVSLCHLGDLGHDLTGAQVAAIGKVDVLFIPVGGFFTIGPETASAVCHRIGPRIVIPMHFYTKRHGEGFSRLHTVEDFASIRRNVRRIGGPEITVEKDSLPADTQTVILQF